MLQFVQQHRRNHAVPRAVSSFPAARGKKQMSRSQSIYDAEHSVRPVARGKDNLVKRETVTESRGNYDQRIANLLRRVELIKLVDNLLFKALTRRCLVQRHEKLATRLMTECLSLFRS